MNRDTWKKLFMEPISRPVHWAFILVISLCYIFVLQDHPIDWDLNAKPIFEKGLQIYEEQNYVYPPWGIILMIPYYLMGAAGSRVVSVLVVGVWAALKKWDLLKFLSFCASPYLLITLAKSNIDILVFVFPLVLWEFSKGKKLETIGRGIALSILLVKPQGSYLMFLYLLWEVREDISQLLKTISIVALITIPISLIGSPPLAIQWLENIANPDPNNVSWWINNISLHEFVPYWGSILILLICAGILWGIFRWRQKRWTRDHTYASLFLGSMFLSPYASQQSFSSPMAFVPSWFLTLAQIIFLIPLMFGFEYLFVPAQKALFVAMVSLIVFQPTRFEAHE